jgi:hypothetical protein
MGVVNPEGMVMKLLFLLILMAIGFLLLVGMFPAMVSGVHVITPGMTYHPAIPWPAGLGIAAVLVALARYVW